MGSVKRKRFLLLVGGIILCGIIFAALRGGWAEPRYQGRKFSAWLDDAMDTPLGRPNTNAFLAVHAIGSNAIPWLIAELDAQGGALQGEIVRTPPRRSRNFFFGTPPDIRLGRAAVGFCYLGPRARGAIPQLVERLGKGQEVRQASVVNALVGLVHRGNYFRVPIVQIMGIPDFLETDEACADIPAVRQEIVDFVRPVAAEPDVSRRLAALYVLQALTDDAGEAAPIFVHAFLSTNRTESLLAEECLAPVWMKPATMIPLLIAALDDPSPDVQANAAERLGFYHLQVSNAVPTLLKLSTSNNLFVQRAATTALRRIDPKGSTKADFKGVH